MEYPNLVAPYYAQKLAAYRRSPCHTNRASQIGDDCVRKLVYDRTAWDKAIPWEPDMVVLLQEGEKHESAVLADLRAAGLQILEQQVALEWKQYQITGHLDAVVLHGGEAIPLDVKSMSPYIWDSIFRRGHGVYPWSEVAEAFSTKPWLRKYSAQGQLYMLLKNVDRFLLVCFNKSTGALAQVNCELDYEYAEELIQRAEQINEHVAAGTLPDRIMFDASICPSCSYYHICLPDHVGRDPFVFVEDDTLLGFLEERAALAETAKAFDHADAWIKSYGKAMEHDVVSIGRWVLKRVVKKSGVFIEIERVE